MRTLNEVLSILCSSLRSRMRRKSHSKNFEKAAMIWVGVLCTFPTMKGGILTQSLGFLYQKGAASTVKPA